MRESDLEAVFRERAGQRGGIVWKFVSPGRAGVPDRIVVWPGGKVHFVELKTDVGELSQIQKVRLGELVRRQGKCYVLAGRTQIEDYIKGGEARNALMVTKEHIKKWRAEREV